MKKYDRDEMLPEAYMGGHRIITWAAFQCQPEWVRQMWMPQAYEMAMEYSAYGDTYWINKEELGPYVELDDGDAPFSGMMDSLRYRHHYDFMIDYWESPFFEPVEKAIRGYLEKICSALGNNDIESAAKIMGAAGHYFEDMGVPAHAVDNQDLEFVRDYVEFPENFELFSLHAYTEYSPSHFLINDYTPKCYGKTPEEVGVSFITRFVELITHARKLIFPLVKTAFNDDSIEAGQLRLKAAKKCAEVFADYFYTASCIAAQRFDEELNELKLVDCWPYKMTAWAPYPYTEMGPMGLKGVNLHPKKAEDGRAQVKTCECQLMVDANGTQEKKTFSEALGAGTYFEYHFKLPKGIYGKLTSLAGIHADLGAQNYVWLKVVADDEIIFEKKVTVGEPALKIDVPINGCQDLKLISFVDNYSQPTGMNNHVVWAEPRLMPA